MVYTFDYDHNYIFPFPIAEVRLRGFNQEKEIELIALIDSGADGSLVPLNLLKELDIPSSKWVRIRGLNGFRRRLPVFLVDFSLGPFSMGFIEVAGDRNV